MAVKNRNIIEKKAFTLLEIVVSLAILALGILGIFSLIPTGIDQSKKGQDQAKAVLLAQSKMEEIIGLASENWSDFYTDIHNFDEGMAKQPYFVGPNTLPEKEIWGWKRSNNIGSTWVPLLGYQWEWHFNTRPSDAPNKNLALVTLTVSWPQVISGGAMSHGDLISKHQPDNIEKFVLGQDNAQPIQFVRLISYVSKGL